MNSHQILISGFGGQGVLFAGKFIAYKGLMEDRRVSWLPSYGPEMRGGTANCCVILSDSPIGSPIVSHPDILMVMNLPSLEKYQSAAEKGASVFLDSTLVEKRPDRADLKVFAVPATGLAKKEGIPTLANMILVGKMIRETGMVSFDAVEEVLKKVISQRHQDLLEYNRKALTIGYEYNG